MTTKADNAPEKLYLVKSKWIGDRYYTEKPIKTNYAEYQLVKVHKIRVIK